MSANPVQEWESQATADSRLKAVRIQSEFSVSSRRVRGVDAILDRQQALKVLNSGGPRLFIAYCAMVRFLRQQLRATADRSFILLASVPSNWEPEIVKAAAKHALTKSSIKVTLQLEGSSRRGGGDDETLEVLKRSKVIILCQEDWEPTPRLRVAVTHQVKLKIGFEEHLRALGRLLECGAVPSELLSEILGRPAEFLDSVFRRGADATAAAMRLKSIFPVAPPIRRLSLQTNKGFGPASEWSRDLQRDLQAYRRGGLSWSDVDKGALLYGPPGTGKTSFALALAQECKLHLVATSHAEWQGSRDGHLGSLLSAMRKSFSQAKLNAPSLLFIDELDSIGSREDFTEYKDYQIQVVNALLQAIDGIDGREGVIVVGACNAPERIDRALLRSGRLERLIHFPLPDAETRFDILQYYFPTLSNDPRLAEVAQQLAGSTGADIERISREARRAARIGGRDLTMEDVIPLMPSRQKPSEDDLFRIAVHEAGHAILAKQLDVGTVVSAEVFDFKLSFPPAGAGWARRGTRHRGSAGFRTRASILNNIAMMLGGMVAEEVVFGDKTTSAGGSDDSDLHSATRMATEMISVFGLGQSLAYFPAAMSDYNRGTLWRDKGMRDEVSSILNREYQRGKQILSSCKPLVLAFAIALKAKGKLQGAELESILGKTDVRSKEKVRDGM